MNMISRSERRSCNPPFTQQKKWIREKPRIHQGLKNTGISESFFDFVNAITDYPMLFSSFREAFQIFSEIGDLRILP